jgi:hypothetical protein
MTTDRPDPSAPIPEDRLPAAVFAITCGALGYPRGVVPPPPVAAFATAMRSAVESMLAAPKDSRGNAPGDPLRKASAGGVFAAVANLARAGLIPGTPATPGTGYLYAQNNVLTGRPSPLGRVRMAYEAGADAETIPAGKTCRLTMGRDGMIADFERDPDNVPRKWEDLRGVVVSVTSHTSGLLKMHWVSAGEIGDRRARSKQPNGGAWASDPVTMARTKALSIIGDRGGFPQAPIPIPGLREWQAAQAGAPSVPALPAPLTPPARALPAPAEADAQQPPPAAPQAPQDAPPPEADPTHAEEPSAQPEAPVQPEAPAEPAPTAEPTWDDVGYAVWEALRPAALGAGLSVGRDDLHAAVSGAVVGARAGAEARGRPLTPAAALAPAAQARLVELALERLRAM